MSKKRTYWQDLNISEDILVLGARQSIEKMEGVIERNIKVHKNEDKIFLEVIIEVEYPLNIPNLSYDLQKDIKQNIEDKVSCRIHKIDIRVLGLYFKGEA